MTALKKAKKLDQEGGPEILYTVIPRTVWLQLGVLHILISFTAAAGILIACSVLPGFCDLYMCLSIVDLHHAMKLVAQLIFQGTFFTNINVHSRHDIAVKFSAI